MKTLFDFIGSEKDIQNHIVDNIQNICEKCFFGEVRKTQTNFKLKSSGNSGIYDILVYHKNGTGTLIEVKKYVNDMYLLSAIGQILYYSELCKINLGEYPRLVIASNYIPDSVRAVIKSNKLPIRLLELDGDKVTLY